MSTFVYSTKSIPSRHIEIDDVWIISSWFDDKNHIYFVREGITQELKPWDFIEFNVDETWDQFEKKICNVCHKLLPTVEFDKNQNGINNRTVRRPSCRWCRVDIDWESIPWAMRKERMDKRPDKEPFECPICQKRTIAWVTSKVVLDHNHETWHVRWWICDSCNTGLWRFKDDIDLIKKAIDFLENN